ncbi:MAG: GNAT family N-acetyltransferase [Clostridium sp.]|uniref:GNAT family N-acetyltransferase n=1 Tax=Clostridium sp. TaxID=1506 RepID=UPI00302C2AB9
MIRKVKEEDFYTLYNWINDEGVIKNSRYQEGKTLEVYRNWFDKKLNDSNSYMFILEHEDKPIGQVNFVIEGGEALITFSVDKQNRGSGWGRKLAAHATEFIFNEVDKCNKAVAYINSENKASIKTFHGLGYSYEIDGEDYKKMYKVLT